MKKVIALLFSIFFGIVIHVNAQTPGIDQRQQSQRERVQQGVVSGELTRRETAHAVQDQRHIRRSERRAEADGIVTRSERTRIHHKQNKASRQLTRNKNDVQSRPGAK